MKGTPKRRFFAARADIAEAFVQMATRRNLTLYNLVSDILKKVVELDQAGASLDQAIQGYLILKTSKEIGFIPVPENLWYETAEISLETDREGAIRRFAEAGEWIGKYSLAKGKTVDPEASLVNCLAPLASDANDFTLEGSDTLRLRCVNPRYSRSYAESFSTLLSNAFETAGYKCENRTASRGMILLAFRKTPRLEQMVRGDILA